MKAPTNAPPHAIWVQRTENLKAYVSLVNDAFNLKIFDVWADGHMHQIKETNAPTLESAKRTALHFIETQRRFNT